jgi:hypothetical protein
LANTKPRRSRPSNKRHRKQLAELNNLLADPSVAGELRSRLEAERDLIAPIIGTPSEFEDSFPTVSNPNPRRPNTESLNAWLKSLFSPEVKAQMNELDKNIAIDKARNATDAERANYLLQGLPNHPLVVMAREIANNIRLESKSAQTVPLETEVGWKVKHWLGPDSAKFNSTPLRGTRSDVLLAVADVYRLLAVKDRDEPGWFVKLTEDRYKKIEGN